MVGHRESKASQIVVLVVVAVPAAMHLNQPECHSKPVLTFEWSFRHKHGIAWHVASPAANILPPCRQIVSINCVFNRPGHSLLIRFIIVNGIQETFGRIDVCRCSEKFNFHGLRSRIRITIGP